jgi:alkanesulfonate monooxygenase SsuD/methylene tetrahydromethanopterin reductase-like flavin-dependent oxidoreductase (luciferase family)
MRFGLFLPQIRLPFDELVTRARCAEAAGFDSVWLVDHLWAPGTPQSDILEGWTTATALAMRTERVRLGHMVLCNQFRHPVMLAKMAATLDVLSGGRLELGLGWGSVAEEMAAFGLGDEPARVRSGRLAETLEILERLFTGERVDYTGRFYRLAGAIARPRPAQARIPIHVGGAGRRLTLPLAAKHADWWNCVSYGVARLAELAPLARPARISVQHPVALLPDDPAARPAAEAEAQRRFGSWGGLIAGTPEEVAEALGAEVALGAEMFVIQLCDFARPATIERFAREVIPRVR